MQSLTQLHNTVKLSTADIENLPNYKKKTAKEWSSSCPVCQGEDRFLFWPDEGNFWCRQCELSGFVDSQTQSMLSDEQRTEIVRRKRIIAQEELAKKQSALQCLQDKRNDIVYHRNLNGQADYVSRKWGLNEDTIDAFKIGYCHVCPTSSDSDSITIPYYWSDTLINLRHRLISPNGNGKYRPEIKGLSTAIFNADAIKDEEWIVLVEGEFKAMVLWQNGIPSIGIPGASIFKDKWLKLFSSMQTIYVALDPGAEKDAIKTSIKISAAGIKTILVTLPTKPDDFFTLYGGNVGQFCRYLENGRVI